MIDRLFDLNAERAAAASSAPQQWRHERRARKRGKKPSSAVELPVGAADD